MRHSFICTPRFHTCLCLQPKLVLIYGPRREGRLSWPGQPERWVNSRPKTATQCLSRLLTGQRHSGLTGQTGVSGLHRATTWQPQPAGCELTTSELQVRCLTDWSTAPPNFSLLTKTHMYARSYLVGSVVIVNIARRYAALYLTRTRYIIPWLLIPRYISDIDIPRITIVLPNFLSIQRAPGKFASGLRHVCLIECILYVTLRFGTAWNVMQSTTERMN